MQNDRLVPFLDLSRAEAELRDELRLAATSVLESGRYLFGEHTAAFEDEFATYCGARHCAGVANGLDALCLILRAYGIGPGDEVIVPANTFIATWLAVSHVGAIPVPVEPCTVQSTFNLDPAAVEAAISPRTRAVIAVHLYGQCADMAPLKAICTQHQILLLEDAAQAHGARFAGKRAGALGDAAAFSFYPGKNLGAFGDGGAVVTNDAELLHRVRQLGNYGSSAKYVHPVAGFNSRLDELQAALLRVKLRVLDRWNARRQSIAALYSASLPRENLRLPSVAPDCEPVWHLYVVKTPNRDALQRFLSSRGVQTLIHYPIPPHLQGAYKDLGYKLGSFPITEAFQSEVLSLPIGPHLDAEQKKAVVDACNDAAEAGVISRQTEHES